MDTPTIFVGLLIWLQMKHFVADYLLQPGWIIDGKGDFRKPGGYVHAGLHVIGSLPALYFVGLDAITVASLTSAEFAVHYLIDHAKAVHARHHPHPTNTRAFWALHGADQLMHHLTYSWLLLVSFGSGR
jgi:hypothetical protein